MVQISDRPQGWATIVVKRGQQTVWKEQNCWGTMAAVLPELRTVVYVGTRYQIFLFARTFEGKLLWQKEVAVGAYGPSELLAAGNYVLAMGRGLLDRHSGDEKYWNKLVDCRTGRIIWGQSDLDIGKPIYMDEKTIITIHRHRDRNDGYCVVERRALLTRYVLFRHRLPSHLYDQRIRVRPVPGGLHVGATVEWGQTDVKPQERSFNLIISPAYPVHASVYPEDSNLPGKVREIPL